MTTFDFTAVRKLADGLNEKLDRCDHGEGAECATMESALRLYAECCCDFYFAAREWARDVFAGRVAFDATTEQTWLAELERLYQRAVKLADVILELDAPCYALDEECRLQSAVWSLTRLRENWVTPQYAVGPSARRQLSDEMIASAKRQIASLPPLPTDWEPSYPDQRGWLHRIRAERSKIKNARP
jgi:hypothetical protein